MKNKLIFFLLVMLLTISAANAQENGLEKRVVSFAGSPDNTIIVYGIHSSSAERIAMLFLKDLYPTIGNTKIIEEKDFDPAANEGKSIVLIGGPQQSSLAAKILSDYGNYTIEESPYGKFVFINNYLIFSDFTGFDNYARTSQSNSPLARFIPVAFVPIAATVASFSLMWLWTLILKIFNSFYHGHITGKIMKKVKKKEINDEFFGFHLKGVRVKYREWIAIIVSAVVFAAAISYTYFTTAAAFALIATNLLINLIVYSFQNSLRLMLDKHHASHTEYNIWWFGVFITLVSGWLGNTFGLAGYVSSDEKHEKAKTRILAKVIAVTFFFGLTFMVFNFIRPSKIYQLIMISSLTSVFLQLLPFAPFSGKGIFSWNKVLWLLLFIPALLCYLVVNLVY